MSVADGSIVRLSFPARAEYLILARLALAGVARAVGMDDEVLADLKLAVTEACGNVVRHAYPGAVEGAVRLTVETRDGVVEVVVEDDGVGLPAHAGTGEAPGPEAESGMGLAIIGAIADELDVQRAKSGGTVLRLRKALHSLQPEPAS